VRLNSPFGTTPIVSLEVAAVTGDSANVCGSGGTGTCTNQSDASIFDLGIAGVDRVEALSFAYSNYIQALCSVSSRPDFGTGSPGEGTRPKACTDPADTAAFNVVAGLSETDETRNIAGYQQADLEGVLRFIGHNICELHFETDADPGDIGFGPEMFCQTPPEWAPLSP
jgi:hypothetical protein